MLKKQRIKHQRLPERLDRLLILLVAEICVAQVAVQHGHIVAYGDRFAIGLDGLLKFLALVPNRADVIFRVRIARIDFHRTLIVFQRQPQSFLLVQGDTQLVQIDWISRILIGELLEHARSFAKLLPDHIEVAHLFVGDFRVDHDDRVLRRRHLCHAWGHHVPGFFDGLSCSGNRQRKEKNTCWKRHSYVSHGESPFSGGGLSA